MFDFISFGLKDLIDIAAVVFLVFQFYRLIRGTVAVNIFIGILVFIVLWIIVTQVAGMRLLGGILDKVMSVGAIVLIVLFQQEIRKFLFSVGAHQRIHNLLAFFYRNELDIYPLSGEKVLRQYSLITRRRKHLPPQSAACIDMLFRELADSVRPM